MYLFSLFTAHTSSELQYLHRTIMDNVHVHIYDRHLLQWDLLNTHTTQGEGKVEPSLYETLPGIVAYVMIYSLWAKHNIKWYLYYREILKLMTFRKHTSIPGDMYPSTGDIEKSGANVSSSHLNLSIMK